MGFTRKPTEKPRLFVELHIPPLPNLRFAPHHTTIGQLKAVRPSSLVADGLVGLVGEGVEAVQRSLTAFLLAHQTLRSRD